MLEFHRSGTPAPWWSPVAIVTIAFAAPRPAFAQDHYCGVYSAYSVLDHYGRSVAFDELLEPEYLSGYAGSTAEEIVAALAAHNVSAGSFSGLGAFDLRTATGPAILHVRGSQGTRLYNHWVVYLGDDDGQAALLDPSRGRSALSYSRLLALWDGVAIATAESVAELNVWRYLGVVQRWSLLVVLGCLIYPLTRVLHALARRTQLRHAWIGSVAGGALLLVAFSAAALALDAFNPDGILRSPIARASIASVRGHEPVPVMTLKQAQRLHAETSRDDRSVVWIDARYRCDYDYGHIPGALNLPIDAAFNQEDRLVSTLAPKSKIVVYCQSEACPYAGAVAQRLRGHGFKNVVRFAAGYREWETAGGGIEPTHPKSVDARDAPRQAPITSGSGR